LSWAAPLVDPYDVSAAGREAGTNVPGGRRLDDPRRRRFDQDFNESDEGRLFRVIRARALDRRKQNALYQDDDMLIAVEEDFAETQPPPRLPLR
jgi:hypothetical protein